MSKARIGIIGTGFLNAKIRYTKGMAPQRLLHLQPTPLTSWGMFSGRRRFSDSPYIESVWEGVALHSGTHFTAADGTIDLTIQKRRGAMRLILSGPSSRAYQTDFEAGDEVLCMRLKPGVHLAFSNSKALTDTDRFLPNAGSSKFWLQSTAVAFPTFATIETFAQHLAKLGLLKRDVVIENALAGKADGTHPRTIQRHSLASTGLTMNHLLQIRRAEHAHSLLGSDHTLTAIAYETGYSNPGHMTNAFKYFFGRTPSTMRRLMAN